MNIYIYVRHYGGTAAAVDRCTFPYSPFCRVRRRRPRPRRRLQETMMMNYPRYRDGFNDA